MPVSLTENLTLLKVRNWADIVTVPVFVYLTEFETRLIRIYLILTGSLFMN